MSNCSRSVAAADLRNRYGIPRSAIVIAFLGRLDRYKNASFAIRVLSEIRDAGGIFLIIAGEGSLKKELLLSSSKKSAEGRVKIIGWLEDPSELLLGSDLLLVPSKEWYSEGLGLVAVEGQAYGIPTLCSMSIPEDANINASLFCRVPLCGGPVEWARAAMRMLGAPRIDVAAAERIYLASPYTDSASLLALFRLYSELLAKT